MTVAELIELLKNHDPTDLVVIGIPVRYGDTAYAVAADDTGEEVINYLGVSHNACILYTNDEVELV